MSDQLLDWRDLRPRIVWSRCNRRLWGATSELPFSREQRRKPRHVLLYFWAGHGSRRVPSGEVAVAPGACHWSRPGWSYACRQSSAPPLGITAIHFDLLDPEGRLTPTTQTALPPEILAVRSPELVEAVTREIASQAIGIRAGIRPDSQRQQAAETLLHGLLLQLAADSAPASALHGPRATMWSEIAQHIQDNLPASLSVARLARRWGYSRSHFSREFTAHFGLPPQAYILNARLALAKELLRETDLPIGQIAEMSGFSGPAPFASRFLQKTKLTPTAYRQGRAASG